MACAGHRLDLNNAPPRAVKDPVHAVLSGQFAEAVQRSGRTDLRRGCAPRVAQSLAQHVVDLPASLRIEVGRHDDRHRIRNRRHPLLEQQHRTAGVLFDCAIREVRVQQCELPDIGGFQHSPRQLARPDDVPGRAARRLRRFREPHIIRPTTSAAIVPSCRRCRRVCLHGRRIAHGRTARTRALVTGCTRPGA